MKKIIFASLIFLTGCATPHQHGFSNGQVYNVPIVATDETQRHPDYAMRRNECHDYATRITNDVAKSAAGGALAGAGIAALTGLIMGVDSGYGQLAGVGALAGGLSAGAGAHISNEQRYKEIMLRCLRQRGFEVY